MYTKKFEIRWDDVDANRHLRNSAYVDYMSHTRMSYMLENGLGHDSLEKHKLGPVALYEHIYYFKEVFPGKPVYVSLQLKGMAEDGRFFKFVHDFYDESGKNFARAEMMGGWINMETRRLTGLPDEFLKMFHAFDKSDDFKILTSEDTRRNAQYPVDINVDIKGI